MSDQAKRLILDFYDKKRYGVPLIMLIVLADIADNSAGEISVSTEDLCIKTQQCKRTVQRQLRRLCKARLLGYVKRSYGGPHQFNVYRLNLQNLARPCHE